jgi:uncharacterized membrane protein
LKSFVAFFEIIILSLNRYKKAFIMFDFSQYLGFLAFLTILTIGFWLMIFLVSIIPYWIGGALFEYFKMKSDGVTVERKP